MNLTFRETATYVDSGDTVRPAPRTRRRELSMLGRFMLQVLGVGIGLGLYLAVRALSAGSNIEAGRNAVRLLRVERAIGIDLEGSIQKAALGVDWLIIGANWFYAFAYWPIIFGTLIYTWSRHRDVFIRYRNSLFFSGLIGLVIFAVFPVAPPRFLDGYVDTVNAAARHNFIAHPSWIINENAALPSFHVGWVVLSAILLSPLTRRWIVRALLTLPGILMSATVIITGNHYLVDVVAGVLISIAGLQLAKMYESWRPPRRHERVPACAPDHVSTQPLAKTAASTTA